MSRLDLLLRVLALIFSFKFIPVFCSCWGSVSLASPCTACQCGRACYFLHNKEKM